MNTRIGVKLECEIVMPQTYHTKTSIEKGGKLSIKGLPFQTGETVEVIVRRSDRHSRPKKYPLRGKSVIYHEPFKGVASDDWEAL